jgi:thioredoxin-dependent peroxiredoxin
MMEKLKVDYKLNIGDKLPKFAGKDHNGYEYTSMDLVGNPLVLYFYPKDDTPGCTTEACSFRDNIEDLNNLDALVIGISPDGPESHKQFIQKHQLNITLLCDENLEICRKFDVVREKEKDGKKVNAVERSTFVIDPQGYIGWIERPVNVEGHTDRVIEAIKEKAT